MSFPFDPNPVDGQVITHAASDGTVLVATYHASKNEWSVRRELPPTQVVTSPERFEVHATHDQQVITWDAATGKWIAQNNPVKLSELRDVHQGYQPELGELPIWSYPAGSPATSGNFYFKTPNAHIKTWDGVTHWESGAVVYHHDELWRAVHENGNVEPKMEEGRITLFINAPGEPSFGLVPMGLSAGPPPSGHVDQPPSKFAFWVDYTNDQQIFLWKWMLKGVDPGTHKRFGEWTLKNTWTCIVWRGITPPPAKVPPNVVIVWIYTASGTPTHPVLGQQMWSLLEIHGNLATCGDVYAESPHQHDLLVYDATTKKWTETRLSDLANLLKPFLSQTAP
jgi:hypothetical protein